MSIELLLLIIAFVLAPLVQQLIRILERQRAPSQGTEQTTSEGRPEPRPAASAPQMARHEFAPSAAGGLTTPSEAAPPTTPASPTSPVPRRHHSVSLRNSPGLRRGIALMTILAPCRAIDPYAWPERTLRR
jgi:hypothetical protein